MNEDKLMSLVHRAVGDFGSILTGALVVLGDRLDLYRHLADAGRPLTSAELATAAGCAERYVREWLNAQAASGYVTLRATAGTRWMRSRRRPSPTRAARRASSGASRRCWPPPGRSIISPSRFAPVRALGWHEHHDDLFRGTERFFRPGYAANLTTSWIPALEGVEDKLRRGAQGGRCRLRARSLDDHHGARLPRSRPSPGSTTTPPRSTQPARPPRRPAWTTGSASRWRRPRSTRGRATTSSGSSIACTTWETRRARRDTSCSSLAARRHLADRRALRQRRPGRQPQPDRPAVLLGIHAGLHPGVAVAGGRYRSRRPGRGSTPARRGDHGRVHAIPAGSRNPVQPGARSPSVRRRMEIFGPKTDSARRSPFGLSRLPEI